MGTTDRRQLQTMAFFTNRELEGHRPLNIFLVNETDHTLEFCDPKCEWGQEGTPMVKHDRYMVEPNQSCVVFAKETSLPLLGTSPMGPKGEFGMRLADLQDEKFTIRYNHPPLGKTTVEVKCPPGFVYFVSNEAHLQHRRLDRAPPAPATPYRRAGQGGEAQGQDARAAVNPTTTPMRKTTNHP